jgi:hypothetical protein
MAENPWVRAILDRVKQLRDPESALREIVPKIERDAYERGRTWGFAEGQARALEGSRATLETLLGGLRSPDVRCPRCDGRGERPEDARGGCAVCRGTGKFAAGAKDPEAPK